ncbi:MAG: hypothetical protein RBR02_09615 [Desulfuromonadaceae bacterium]|nr:hypothetical protein [Desulfuromonadaceae bacterium]
MKILILIFFLFTSAPLFAEFVNASPTVSEDDKIVASAMPDPAQIKQDFINQDTQKYQHDNLKIVEKEILIQNQILKSDFTGIVEGATTVDCNSFVAPPYSATIYDIDPLGGVVTCMFAISKKLYNPIDLFTVSLPLLKENHALDFDLAKQNNQNFITQKKAIIQSLKDEKKQIAAQTTTNNNYLNATELLLAGILTDRNVIDFESSRSTGTLMLKDDYTSAFFNENGTIAGDNGKFIENDIVSILANYNSLSNVILNAIFAIMFVLLLFTTIQKVFKAVDPDDDTKEKSKFHFFASLIIGALVFWPITTTPPTAQSYKEVESNFQSLSRHGFYFFNSLADEITKAMIDDELDTLINKSGIGSASDIINNAAKMAQQKKLSDTYKSLYNTALTNFTDISLFSTASNAFPMSEKWAYATSYVKPLLSPISYYHVSPAGQTVSSAYTSSATKEESYPKYAFSFGYRINQKKIKADMNHEAFKKAYLSLIQTDPQVDEKIKMLKSVIKTQYELFRDIGYLSVLQIPVIDMQAQSNQKLFKSEDITKEIDKKIDSDSYTKKFMGDLVSSIPYMFVPGAQTVFSTTQTTFAAIADGAKDTLVGWIGSKFGTNIAIGVVTNSAAYTFSQMTISVFLQIMPIIVIIGIGLVRFLIIMVKILAFHFGSLLLFALVFTKNGSEYMKKFCIAMLLLMLEQPIFPISVYLAFVSNSILHNFGNFVSKSIISGMMDNNSAQNYVNWSIEGLFNVGTNMASVTKIYLIQGALEVCIIFASIALIYKFLISYHSYLFETLSLKATDVLDDSIKGVAQQIETKGKI